MRFLTNSLLPVGKENTLSFVRLRGHISLFFNKIIALNCNKFVDTSEPAAVFGFHGKIKVGEFKVPESAAVGSLVLKPVRTVIGHWGVELVK
jgi:hypothetical protein